MGVTNIINIMTLYRKWRPDEFGGVVGQDHVTRTHMNALRNKRVAHAYLFYGSRGTGKTTVARILAKALNCTDLQGGEPCNQCDSCQMINAKRSMDIMEIDAASNRGIDDIRSLRDKVALYPSSGKYKVYIIDEAHMLTDAASNALLKTLEEPPAHVVFILATTEPHKMAATIRSRCQEHVFRRLSQTAIMGKLITICDGEGIEIDPLGLRLIAGHAEGSLRDAETVLEQLSAGGEPITVDQINDLFGISDSGQVNELVDCILSGHAAQGLAIILRVSKEGLDLQRFAEDVTARLRDLLFVKSGAGSVLDVPQDVLEEMKERVKNVDQVKILKAARSFESAQFGVQGQKSLPLELAMVEAII